MRNRRYIAGLGMDKPYARDDTLKSWIVFPNEQLRRAYVQTASVVRGSVQNAQERERRLGLLVTVCGGELKDEEPTQG